MRSVQEEFWPKGMCFGCGPANASGLHLRSFRSNHGLTAEWDPQPHLQAFPGILCGGVIGTLLDCHSNWMAALALAARDDTFEMTVTSDYLIKLVRPTPLDGPVVLNARTRTVDVRRVEVDAELLSDGQTCATCFGTFVRPRQPVLQAH